MSSKKPPFLKDDFLQSSVSWDGDPQLRPLHPRGEHQGISKGIIANPIIRIADYKMLSRVNLKSELQIDSTREKRE